MHFAFEALPLWIYENYNRKPFRILLPEQISPRERRPSSSDSTWLRVRE